MRKTFNYKIRSTHATHAEQITQQENVVLPSEQQNPQPFQQLNNSFFPQNHKQFPNITASQFSPFPTQSYTQKQTNEQPVAQLRSEPPVLPNNLQNYQNQTAPDFPASSKPFGANVPNFVDSQTQSNAKQNQFCYPNNEPSNLIVNNSHASASNANFNPVTQLANLDYKHSLKLTPVKLQNFNRDPLHFHEWINNFHSMIHHNTSITDTHRITYLQNSESGKAKDLIHAYSCDPSYYQAALNHLINHFCDRTIVVNALINQLKKLASQSSEQAKFYCHFVLFEKTCICSVIPIPWFYSRPSINNATKKAKEKVPHNLILIWTEHCPTEFRSDPSLAEFQQWLELQAQVYDKVNRENPIRNTFPNSKKFGSSKIKKSTLVQLTETIHHNL